MSKPKSKRSFVFTTLFDLFLDLLLELFHVLSWVALLVSCTQTPQAQAFSLGDHKRIALQATREFEACFPGVLTPAQVHELWTSDLMEDLDLIHKELTYSHYFNPEHSLKMRRLDSSVRVSRLERSILSRDLPPGVPMSLRSVGYLGHAVHHIQDMASPPHVAPIVHGPTDGFESYKFAGDISSGLQCQDLKPFAKDLEELLVETARETLRRIRTERLPHQELSLSEAFWQPASEGTGFGQYGLLGNHFSATSIRVDGAQVYGIEPEFYAEFKQRQLKLAVRSTVRAIHWFTSLLPMRPAPAPAVAGAASAASAASAAKIN